VLSAGRHQDPIELLKQLFGVPRFIFQVFTFRPSNLSLNTVFVEGTKQFFQASAQVQAMKSVGEAFPQPDLFARSMTHWPDLKVLPFPFVQISLQMQKHLVQLVWVIYQGFAMVRKRQGHQAPTGKPALDATERKSIRQAGAGRRSGNRKRSVTVDRL
jgi:hypothetical protein